MRYFEGGGFTTTKQYEPPGEVLYILKCFGIPRNFGRKHRNGTFIGDLFAGIRECNDAQLVNKNHPSSVELNEEALRILSFYYT